MVAERLDSSKYLPNIIQPRISLFYKNTLEHVTVYINLHLYIYRSSRGWMRSYMLISYS